jgi:cytochrome c biogenesis protein CcmG, thiol:disulfide interchange protein DsbE
VNRVWIAGLALVVLAATGCQSAKTLATPGPQDTASPRLVAAAHLRPCPSSRGTPIPGGLPDVTLSCLGAGPNVHLAGLDGLPTVVNVWGSWCGPCQEEAGYLSAAYDADRTKVRFLGVDTEDGANDALSFGAAVKPPVRYPSVSDPDRKVLLGIHFPGPPETVFVNAAGRVVHIHGGQYRSTAEVQADIAKYLHVTT